jgi:hypothetical protein
MKREIIERLAIDSAARELNEDTEALFRMYLAEHPESNKWADEMSLIYGETETAVMEKIGGFKGDVKSEPVRIEHTRFNWWPVLRWAAVVIFAACIGVVVGRWSKLDTISQRPRMVAAISDLTEKRPVFSMKNIDNSFWRDKAVGMLNVKAHSINGAIIHSQGLWDRYRQYIKEKYNE